MPVAAALIAAWARSAVAPHGGAFAQLQPHEVAAPVLRGLLARAGLAPSDVDAVVLGNALGAGGNPARVLALAAGLPDACAALSVDTQCCSGLDAVSVAAGLIASGQAEVVVAGGVEAWSRAPIRQHRPLNEHEPARTFERPAFAPDPERDPDLLQAAADYAARHGLTRAQQDAYAVHSHQRAVAAQAELAGEIVPVAGVAHDLYPRPMTLARAARLPRVVGDAASGLSALTISAKADGVALVLMLSAAASRRLGLRAAMAWHAGVSVGCDPREPLVAAERAAREVLRRGGIDDVTRLAAVELHDAFAVQGLSFCQALGLAPETINRRGGGLARGHPIGASAAIALVRLLADLAREGGPGALGLTAVAGAGGIGAAALVERL